VWIHPIRGPQFADYATEKAPRARDLVHLRLALRDLCLREPGFIFSGIYDELPNLKIITTTMGGNVPFLRGQDRPGLRTRSSTARTDENPVARRRA